MTRCSIEELRPSGEEEADGAGQARRVLGAGGGQRRRPAGVLCWTRGVVLREEEARGREGERGGREGRRAGGGCVWWTLGVVLREEERRRGRGRVSGGGREGRDQEASLAVCYWLWRVCGVSGTDSGTAVDCLDARRAQQNKLLNETEAKLSQVTCHVLLP
eukprot:217886-Rhodomonas_salina.1